MKYAIIESGIVANIAESSSALSVNWIDGTGAKIGDLWDGTTFSKPVPTLPDAVTMKKAQLSDKAFSVETQGITVGTDSIATDRGSVSRITSSLSLIGRRPAESIPFKTVDGWATGTKGSLETIQNAVWAHLKATATNEQAHYDAIDLLTTAAAVVAYDISTGW